MGVFGLANALKIIHIENQSNSRTGLTHRRPPSLLMRLLSPLQIAAALTAVMVALPVLSLALRALQPDQQGVWTHLVETALADYLWNSTLLALGAGLGAAGLGTLVAWLVTRYRFPGCSWLEWALLLPLAMPTYVIAYVYTDALQFAGPLQTGLREQFGWERGDYWFFEIRSLGGAIVIFSLVFYPYVYALARSAFLERSGHLEEAARTLGLKQGQVFWRVLLPLARPAIVAGTALVIMESLAEFGAVSYFGVNTLTTGIYRAWYAFGDPIAAAQLAIGLLGLIALALALEHQSRGRARYHDAGGPRPQPIPLRGHQALGAAVMCLLPLAGGFLIPAGLLLQLTLGGGDSQWGTKYLHLASNSLQLAGITSLLALVVALVLAYATRVHAGPLMRGMQRLASLGYAVPGTVIAVGALIPLTALDHALIGWMQQQFGFSPGLLLTGSALALVFAYLTRFLVIALHAVENSLERIRLSLDDAARVMGLNRGQVLWRIHLPLLRGGLLSALILVFVEVMKELPATLVLRPFNFDTLATQVYTLAADERLSEAATPSLMIVAVGLIPVWMLARAMRR